MASRAGRQPSPTTEPLPPELRGRGSDGAQNRPPRQPPGQGPRRREPGDAGDGWREGGTGRGRPSSSGPIHVRPPTPAAPPSPASHMQVAPTRNGLPGPRGGPITSAV